MPFVGLMTPTARALQLASPAAELLQHADLLFSTRSRPAGFDPLASQLRFRIAASDYLDPLFLPALVSQLKQQAPQVTIELLPLSAYSGEQKHDWYWTPKSRRAQRCGSDAASSGPGMSPGDKDDDSDRPRDQGAPKDDGNKDLDP